MRIEASSKFSSFTATEAKADRIVEIAKFVKNIKHPSLVDLLQELERKPWPYSEYFKLSKKEWKRKVDLLGGTIYDYIHDSDDGAICGDDSLKTELFDIVFPVEIDMKIV